MEDEERKETEQGERLARFLAHAGIASRRHAEVLIAAGRVRVNEAIVTTQGVRVDPARDQIYVDGQLVSQSNQHVYLLLHKPAGYVSTVSDPQGRPTVLSLLPEELQRLRVYPVGRLDRDTSGLLLLTNDGEFALHLTHPRYEKEKHYKALVRGRPDEAVLQTLRAGVIIDEDGGKRYKTAPARVSRLRQSAGESWLALSIREGHKRQVRRMLDALGYPVLRLVRSGVGPLTLHGVAPGEWRHLSNEEVRRLLA